MNSNYYGSEFQYDPEYELYVRQMQAQRKKEKKMLRSVGLMAGGCIIAYVLLQNVIALPYMFDPLNSLYTFSTEFMMVTNIIFSIVGLWLPFVVGGRFLRRKGLFAEDYGFGKPESVPLMLLSIPFGFLICLIGNVATSSFVGIMETAGVELTAPDFSVPKGIFARLIYAVWVALVPALVEEFAMRSVVMQPLRRYGDAFAIVASSLVFGVLHGNLVQAPFAFIAGAGIGYAVCITNSVWTGVLIHFCNNFYSVLVDFLLEEVTDEKMLNLIWIVSQIALYAVCIIGTLLFFIVKKNRKLSKPKVNLKTGEKWKSFILNPTMLIAIAIMLYITADYIKLI